MDRRFTLIELLVVISVIAILASMLLPSLAKAREKSKQAYCLNNLKSVGITKEMYLNDFNDVLPPRTWNGKDSLGLTWMGTNGELGAPYNNQHDVNNRPFNSYLNITVNSSKVSQCPSDLPPDINHWDNNGSEYNSHFQKYGSSYVANLNTQNCTIDTLTTCFEFKIPLAAGLIFDPAKTFLMSEYGGIFVLKGTRSNYLWHSSSNRWNYIFVDGHAAMQTIVGASSGTLNLYESDNYKFTRGE